MTERNSVLDDMVLTCRAVSEGTGTNYRAGHALGCLAFGIGFALAGFWLLLTGVGIFDALRFFGPALLLLVGWRILLKQALWIWKIQTTLHPSSRRPPITTWISVVTMVLLVGLVVGALLRVGGYISA